MNKTVIECNGIAAGYVKGLNILQGVDLIVNEKEIVSIIGPNGAGKSTLLKAIMGIINISGGRFFINGVEKTNTPTHQIVNEGVGYVPQVENVFPSLTIEENLEIGSWSVKDNMKQSISKIFGDFPMLKERQKDKAGNLSGGQRQILALARALVTSPNILLLDEATSSLDSRSEKKIQTSLDKLMKNKTSLVIAHRLSTIIDADKIILLQNGKIEDIDKHSNLLKKSKIYKNL